MRPRESDERRVRLLFLVPMDLDDCEGGPWFNSEAEASSP